MVNKFLGLFTGPLDHRATSVINAIASGEIDMGAVIILDTTPPPLGEILPRVKAELGGQAGSPLAYGIAVGGDNDGIYGEGFITVDDPINRATLKAGQGVVVVTQGRCPARVRGQTTGGVNTQINIGDPLTHGFGPKGRLELASSGENVIARALNTVGLDAVAMIAVDFKREGRL